MENKDKFIAYGNMIIKEYNRIDKINDKLKDSGLFNEFFYEPVLDNPIIDKAIDMIEVLFDKQLMVLFSYYFYDCDCNIKAGKITVNDINCPKIKSLDKLYDWYLVENKEEVENAKI